MQDHIFHEGSNPGEGALQATMMGFVLFIMIIIYLQLSVRYVHIGAIRDGAERRKGIALPLAFWRSWGIFLCRPEEVGSAIARLRSWDFHRPFQILIVLGR